MDLNVLRSLKDVPNSAGYPPEQRLVFYHGIASALEALNLPELAQEFAALRDQGKTTGAQQNDEMPYGEADFIG